MAVKGGQKTGGRKKGTPNKRSAALLDEIRKAVGDEAYHPVVEMALVATMDIESIGDPLAKAHARQLKMQANKEVAPYVAARLKAVEHTAPDGTKGFIALPVVQSVEEFLKRAKKVKDFNG